MLEHSFYYGIQACNKPPGANEKGKIKGWGNTHLLLHLVPFGSTVREMSSLAFVVFGVIVGPGVYSVACRSVSIITTRSKKARTTKAEWNDPVDGLFRKTPVSIEEVVACPVGCRLGLEGGQGYRKMSIDVSIGDVVKHAQYWYIPRCFIRPCLSPHHTFYASISIVRHNHCMIGSHRLGGLQSMSIVRIQLSAPCTHDQACPRDG